MEYLITFLIGVAANLFVMLARRANWILPPIELGRLPRRPYIILLAQMAIHAVLNISLTVTVLETNASKWWLIVIPVSFGILLVLVWKQLNQVIVLLWSQLNKFRAVGITDADVEIKSGIDYTKGLDLCRNQLRFLGIGAAKLTREPEFENTLARCRTDRPTKFLLLSPVDERLIQAARRFHGDRDEYKGIVVDSLNKISQVKARRALNIEVRFYTSEPIFRMMFIDESLCLFSYYVLGEGDGSQLPQLHVMSAPQSAPSSSSFYRALELYFEDLWGKSQQWDFRQYLTNV